ncbi:response regulator [Glaciecola sp. SC05]|uniref:response regulator n=1 Tax=Glaciecola sp. SC05 TaxID=1987355 RepID=UPI003527E257
MTDKTNAALAAGRILLVEDDQSLSDWIKDYLVAKNFHVEQCFRGDEAVALTLSLLPDLLILDGMLPGLDGIEVCKQLRPLYKGRIIMLTARDTELDEVLALDIGADDYLSKPVRAKVLLARINTQLRHQSKIKLQTDLDNTESMRLGNLYLKASSRTTMLRGEAIDLSSGEFDMLWLLAKQAGITVTRDDLTKVLRGFDYDGFDRSVDLKVSRLRKKLADDPKHPKKIVTVWGKGYKLVPDAWQ